jgi:DNA-binding CsgD family transcriptional regulator
MGIRLTKREQTVVQCVLDGHQNKEIAYQLGISENTIKVYLCKLYRKLNVGDRLQLNNWARAYAESQTRVAALVSEIARQTGSDAPTDDRLLKTQAAFELVRATLQTAEFTPDQLRTIFQLLMSAEVFTPVDRTPSSEQRPQ